MRNIWEINFKNYHYIDYPRVIDPDLCLDVFNSKLILIYFMSTYYKISYHL